MEGAERVHRALGKWSSTRPKNCSSACMRPGCQVSDPCPRPPREREYLEIPNIYLEIRELWKARALHKAPPWSPLCVIHTTSLSVPQIPDSSLPVSKPGSPRRPTHWLGSKSPWSALPLGSKYQRDQSALAQVGFHFKAPQE